MFTCAFFFQPPASHRLPSPPPPPLENPNTTENEILTLIYFSFRLMPSRLNIDGRFRIDASCNLVPRGAILCVLFSQFISLKVITLVRNVPRLFTLCSCSCNRDERRCIPSPRELGTPCGEDGDYYFGQCNQGPGYCVAIESEFGNFGVCVGIPTFGAPCNDFSVCTKNDTCKVVFTDDHLVRGLCVGIFDAELPCNDYDDRCTINDRYVPRPKPL
jgi:hypothetical protein